MVQYWRAAGMTYLKYSNLSAELLRRVLKEPMRTKALEKASFSMTKAEWEKGVIVKRSKLSCLSIRALSVLILRQTMSVVYDFAGITKSNPISILCLSLASLILQLNWNQYKKEIKLPRQHSKETCFTGLFCTN